MSVCFNAVNKEACELNRSAADDIPRTARAVLETRRQQFTFLHSH